jgi:hypothetical protein
MDTSLIAPNRLQAKRRKFVDYSCFLCNTLTNYLINLICDCSASKNSITNLQWRCIDVTDKLWNKLLSKIKSTKKQIWNCNKSPSLRYMMCCDVCVPLNPWIMSAVWCSAMKPALMKVFGFLTSTTFPRLYFLQWNTLRLRTPNSVENSLLNINLR